MMAVLEVDFLQIDNGEIRGMAISASSLSVRVPGRFLIIAHRGYSSDYQENSIDAFKEAIAIGSDLIEADLRESEERTIVLSHDYVGDERLNELIARGIIQFSTVLDIIGENTLLLLDLKDQSLSFVRNVFNLIDQREKNNQVVFGVRNIDQMCELRKLDPETIILGLLPRGKYNFDDFYNFGGNIGRIWEDDLEPATIEKARGDGSRPIWITPRGNNGLVGAIEARRQKVLMESGFDGVLVNDPRSAIITRSMALRRTD